MKVQTFRYYIRQYEGLFYTEEVKTNMFMFMPIRPIDRPDMKDQNQRMTLSLSLGSNTVNYYLQVHCEVYGNAR